MANKKKKNADLRQKRTISPDPHIWRAAEMRVNETSGDTMSRLIDRALRAYLDAPRKDE